MTTRVVDLDDLWASGEGCTVDARREPLRLSSGSDIEPFLQCRQVIAYRSGEIELELGQCNGVLRNSDDGSPAVENLGRQRENFEIFEL